MAMMSDVELPVAHIRAQVAAAIDVIVQLARLRDGRRVVWEIAVVEGTRHGESIVEPVPVLAPRGCGVVPSDGQGPDGRRHPVGSWRATPRRLVQGEPGQTSRWLAARLLPHDLQMRHPSVYPDEIAGDVADHLVGDPDIVGLLGVHRLWRRLNSLPFSPAATC
jgi:hypothetical protein